MRGVCKPDALRDSEHRTPPPVSECGDVTGFLHSPVLRPRVALPGGGPGVARKCDRKLVGRARPLGFHPAGDRIPEWHAARAARALRSFPAASSSLAIDLARRQV